MEWINLNTAIIDSPEFALAEPAQMGTWLRLLRYCAGQENGGVIAQAKRWTPRQWMACVRVLPEEVAECSLWTWEGEDLVVHFYPADREKQVKNARAAGSEGGRAKTQAKTQAAKANGLLGGRPKSQISAENSVSHPENPSATPAETQADNPSETQKNPTEDKIREEKVIEDPPARAGEFIIPTDEEVLAFARAYSCPSIGARAIPDEWMLDWHHFRLENPATYPADWQEASARRFRRDFQARHPKAVGIKKTAAAATGAAHAFSHEINPIVKVPVLKLTPTP